MYCLTLKAEIDLEEKGKIQNGGVTVKRPVNLEVIGYNIADAKVLVTYV